MKVLSVLLLAFLAFVALVSASFLGSYWNTFVWATSFNKCLKEKTEKHKKAA
jgi:hypothetical protein